MSAERLAVSVRGAVQGVGFRPFVYRVATDLGLSGWVRNDAHGVEIEVEGPRPTLERFARRLERERPPRALVQSLDVSFLQPVGLNGFEIRASERSSSCSVLVLPDIAPCADCLSDVADPANRRYRYPFTNCTNCGPRLTVIEELPYDRAATTMRGFTMCPACAKEYDDPADRRFHAQPNACSACGPSVELWDSDGTSLAAGDGALRQAVDVVRSGEILALKGLGGFVLLVDARDEEAVDRLRKRKAREEKPFALLFADIAAVRARCLVSDEESALLAGAEAPIVLLRRRHDSDIAPSVAPDNPYLGAMLPSTPLHRVLADDLGFPVVATSGNRTDEPICTDEVEALQRLGGIADAFLVHDRPIARHCDDSVTRLVRGREQVLRRARGYAPLPASRLSCSVPFAGKAPPVLAVGGHQKNTVTLTLEGQAFVSQHVGDLDSPEACGAFERVVADLLRFYGVAPAAVAHDLHPDYASSRWLESNLPGVPRIAVQHHHAHLAACLADNEVEVPVLGVTWDGSGYGHDRTIWGGEFLLGDARRVKRVARLRTFFLPGGEQAVREPRRSALGLLYAMLEGALFEGTSKGAETRRATACSRLETHSLICLDLFSPSELAVLSKMLERGINSPITSSAGRLFDAVAALLGLRRRSSFEGQAAMDVEYAAEEHARQAAGEAYEVRIERSGTMLVVDWEPAVRAVLDDLAGGVAPGRIAARFHEWLALSIAEVAARVGCECVALTGGVFQNRLLSERATLELERAGLQVFTHRRVPPNDGGISLGQAAVATALLGGVQGGESVLGRTW